MLINTIEINIFTAEDNQQTQEELEKEYDDFRDQLNDFCRSQLGATGLDFSIIEK